MIRIAIAPRWPRFSPLAPVRRPRRARDSSASSTIVVIYAENHSFDNLYGMFPGADGVAQATAEQRTQVDPTAARFRTCRRSGWPTERRTRAFRNACRTARSGSTRRPIGMSTDKLVPSPIHAYWHHQEQIAGGANNRSSHRATSGAWPMGYYDGSSMKLWQWAREYTLADRFFQGAFGGSFLNHFWLVCACTPDFAKRRRRSARSSTRTAGSSAVPRPPRPCSTGRCRSSTGR
jgi:phospholipase C